MIDKTQSVFEGVLLLFRNLRPSDATINVVQKKVKEGQAEASQVKKILFERRSWQ